jgi:phosphohistidine phosphatase
MNTTPKTLILVRHAKSSWADPHLTDHDRPLNKRGADDAPRMGRRLAKRGDLPEVIVTSSALRALETAKIFASKLEIPTGAVLVEPKIYGAGVEQLIDLIQDFDEGVRSVLLVGHNPTMSELVHRLTGEELGELPTCSVVTLRVGSGDWSSVGKKTLDLIDFDYPKKKKE